MEPDVNVFPANVVSLIEARAIQTIDPENTLVQTVPVNTMSVGQVVAILPVGWDPGAGPEIGQHRNPSESAIQTYTIMIQALVSDFDEGAGINRLSLLSRKVRNMLNRDQVLHRAMEQLVCTEDDVREHFQALSVVNQRFMVTETDSDGSLLLSVTECRLTTQVH